MRHNVDISEVIDFSDDLQKASSDIKSSLDSVKEQIEQINSMDSFSGKAAKEAKHYFSDLHLTILESFQGLFDDLEENLKQHLDTFESQVDVSESAVIKSNYLQEVKEDVNEVFKDLEKQDEIISDTIKKVSDISSAKPPDFSDVDEWQTKAVKKLKELDEDLASFTGEGNETDVKAVMNKIETAMDNAKTSEGKARFADFEGASENSELVKLKAYNEDKEKALEEKIENLDDQSKFYLKQVQEDYENKTIDKAAYESIRFGMIQNGPAFVQDARENNLSNTVSEQVKKDVSEWADKTYNMDNMIAQSDSHQAIDPYNAMTNPDLLFPITYRSHDADVMNGKTKDKDKEGSNQNFAAQGNMTDEEKKAMKNYLNQLDGRDTDVEEVNEQNKVNSKPSENQLSETNKELAALQEKKKTERKAPEDVNRAREPLTVWDQKDVVSPHSDLAGETDMLGHIATAGLNFAFDDIGTIFDPNSTMSERFTSAMFSVAKPIKLGDKVYGAYKGAHKTERIDNSNKYWNKTANYKNVKVYQRDDIINPKMKDIRGRSNSERMEKGLAPIGSDGRSVNLHHTTQRNKSSITEVTDEFHKKNDSIIHINPNTMPSGINRLEFNKWKTSYWKNRSKDF